MNPTVKVKVPLENQTVQFECTDSSTGLPAAVTWSLSSIEVGTIDASGLFTPNGTHTGETWVTCQGATTKAETKLTVVISARDNPGASPSGEGPARGPPGKSDSNVGVPLPVRQDRLPEGLPLRKST